MYAGEMCNWYYELSIDQCAQSGIQTHHTKDKHTTELDSKTQESAAKVEASASIPTEYSLWCVMEPAQGEEFVSQWRTNFDPVKLGIGFLSKYIDAARGPLKEHDWNYATAVQFIVRLKKV